LVGSRAPGHGPCERPARADRDFLIGSGYSGLSAALELSRNGRNVTVVDALAFGEATSSRNGGGVSAGLSIGKGISGGPGQANREGGQVQLIEIYCTKASPLMRTATR
jgi:hypothetical protein